MKGLVPDFILNNYIRNRLSGSLEAYTMFIDISGFTSMTENLMAFGKEGAEVLSGIINGIFSTSIRAVYDHGGFVASFAGDAFTAIFQLQEAEYVLKTAFTINEIFKEFGLAKTKYGDFQLNVKIGMSYGHIEYCIIDSEIQKTYYFRGEAIDSCAKAEHKADKMQVVADNVFMDRVCIDIDTDKTAEKWHILSPVPISLPVFVRESEFSPVPDIESQFISKAVLEQKDEGEFREILSCFISFMEDKEGEYKDAIKHIIKNCYNYGGYFNRVDFGDKGGTALIIFGAPVSMEKLYMRAADFAISLKTIPRFIYRAGLTTGIAFAGFIGSGIRREYSALGNIISLSARLMMKACWGQILTSLKIKNSLAGSYNVDYVCSEHLKGFSNKINIFELKSKIIRKQHLTYSGRFIGRVQETIKLKEFISPIFGGRFGGIVYIDGPAGIGKSRFIADFKDRSDKKDCHFFHLQCDEILRKPFNPIVYFLKAYFDQVESSNKAQNKKAFQMKYKELTDQTVDIDIKNELIRTESILGAIIGLEWKDSLYCQLDAKGRFENTLYAVKNLIKANSLQKPLIIILDDCHWIDPESLELLKVILSNVEDYPFVMLALCRLYDDGSKFNLFMDKEAPIAAKRLELSAFDRNNITELILDKLQTDKIPIETENFIMEKCDGNPFFGEQITLYLIENNKLDHEFNINSEALELPSGINQIISARIDRLSAKMKETVKTASVLGREFALVVLKKMLLHLNIVDSDAVFKRQLSDGESQQIWEVLSEMSYIFRHALIRDAVYEIQLKKTLRNLHNLAGNIIEELYYNNLESHHEELANHYENAENTVKALIYCEKCGDAAKNSYYNKKAIRYYDTVLRLCIDAYKELAEGEAIKYKTTQVKVIVKKAFVLDIIGKWDYAIQLLEEGIELAESLQKQAGTVNLALIALYAELKCSLGWFLMNQGHYSRAREMITEAKGLSDKAGDKEVYSQVLRTIAALYANTGDYDKALSYYNESKNICKELGDMIGYSSVVGNIGLMYWYKGENSNAMEYYIKQMECGRELGNKSLFSYALGNIGNIHYYNGDYDKAMECYSQKKKICEELADMREYSLAIGNMGNILADTGDYNKAMEYYNELIKISLELGDKRNYSITVGNMGNEYKKQGDYDNAMKCFMEKKIICSEVGNKTEIIDVLYNIGLLNMDLGNFSQALEHFRESLSISEELGAKRAIALNLAYMAITYQYIGDFNTALRYYGLCDNGIRELCKSDAPYFIFNKAMLFLELSKSNEARSLAEESCRLAVVINRKDIVFMSTVLINTIDRNIEALKQMLNDSKPDSEQSAVINFELWKLTRDEQFRKKAESLCQKLSEKTPKHEYKKRLEELINP